MITASPVATVRFTHQVAEELKRCDRVTNFTESGWFFAYGWVGDKVTVKTHADSKAEYDSLMGNGKPFEGYLSR